MLGLTVSRAGLGLLLTEAAGVLLLRYIEARADQNEVKKIGDLECSDDADHRAYRVTDEDAVDNFKLAPNWR